jgi:hypothetical protein
VAIVVEGRGCSGGGDGGEKEKMQTLRYAADREM